LLSLTPEFADEQHARYVERLDAATDDPRNRNIALSGRHGTGKSSVLDNFYEDRRSDTVRLAISTLSPGSEDLTNRLQKEVLKQLVYSADADTLRHSRFSRRPMSKERAARESVAAVAALGVPFGAVGAAAHVRRLAVKRSGQIGLGEPPHPTHARTLFVSETTIKTYVSRLLTKLDITNRTQAAILGHEAGLFDHQAQ
jgi:hypothetical protein